MYNYGDETIESVTYPEKCLNEGGKWSNVAECAKATKWLCEGNKTVKVKGQSGRYLLAVLRTFVMYTVQNCHISVIHSLSEHS